MTMVMTMMLTMIVDQLLHVNNTETASRRM
jgi:hypothetical protein